MLNNKNCNNESNPLEGVADALVTTISTVSVLTLQIASNTLILGSKRTENESDLIKGLRRKKDGLYYSTSKVLTSFQMKYLENLVDQNIKKSGYRLVSLAHNPTNVRYPVFCTTINIINCTKIESLKFRYNLTQHLKSQNKKEAMPLFFIYLRLMM